MKVLAIYNKVKYVLWMVLYGIFYFVSYSILEKEIVPTHIIHCSLDDKIPFCEYFVIPYFLWFAFVLATVVYFGIFCESKREYACLAISLCFGMTVFLIVSAVYPNGHNLRPELEGNGIFMSAVRRLYSTDTSTNILPSIHVFNTVACWIALIKNNRCRKNKLVCVTTSILSISIIASTMFLKQHSAVDVIFAIVLNAMCYVLCYKCKWQIKNQKSLRYAPGAMPYFFLKQRLK